MWKFKSGEEAVRLKTRIEKLLKEDRIRALSEIKKSRKKVESIMKVLGTLSLDALKTDTELWSKISNAYKYAEDLKRFLDEYEKSLISKGGKHD